MSILLISVSTKKFTTYLSDSSYINSIFLNPVTEKEVENELNQLKESKSRGYDDMSPKMSTVNCFLLELYPMNLKLRLLLQYSKQMIKKNFKLSTNFSFPKIREKLMYSRVIGFLNKHEILFQNQYGFRKKKTFHKSCNYRTCDKNYKSNRQQ